jgi:hypothetical protein
VPCNKECLAGIRLCSTAGLIFVCSVYLSKNMGGFGEAPESTGGHHESGDNLICDTLVQLEG